MHRELGITFVYVTHNQSEALAMADRIVIMKDGRIEQVGTSREIYRTPVSRFVAEFVGANNVLSGVVAARNNDLVTIATPQGDFEIENPPDRSLNLSEPVTFVVSADRVVVDGAPDGSRNLVTGKVVAAEFNGSGALLFLELDHGLEFQVQRPNLRAGEPEIPIGSSLRVSWTPSDAFLLRNQS